MATLGALHLPSRPKAPAHRLAGKIIPSAARRHTRSADPWGARAPVFHEPRDRIRTGAVFLLSCAPGRDSRCVDRPGICSVRKCEFPLDARAVDGWPAADVSPRLRL